MYYMTNYFDFWTKEQRNLVLTFLFVELKCVVANNPKFYLKELLRMLVRSLDPVGLLRFHSMYLSSNLLI
jgi:hypothetical protein